MKRTTTIKEKDDGEDMKEDWKEDTEGIEVDVKGGALPGLCWEGEAAAA